MRSSPFATSDSVARPVPVLIFNLTFLLAAVERVLLALWVGGLWVIGFVAAPVLFTYYIGAVAGDVAGRLFSAMSLVGLACGGLLFLLAVYRARRRAWRDWRVGVLALMLAITAVGEFGVAARMRLVKQATPLHEQRQELRAEFGRLHAMANTLFVINSLLGLALVVAGTRPRVQPGS